MSDLAFAIETRLGYLPKIISFIDENLLQLNSELTPAGVKLHLDRAEPAAFTYKNQGALQRVVFGTTALITESRSCFENLATFYQQFLETYCGRGINKKLAYNVVARSTGKYAWATNLYRIRGDLIHARSLFFAYEVTASRNGWLPLFSMNWRPGHFSKKDRISLQMLVDIVAGLQDAATAMRQKIVGIATVRKR